jgi:hypothetical protein
VPVGTVAGLQFVALFQLPDGGLASHVASWAWADPASASTPPANSVDDRSDARNRDCFTWIPTREPTLSEVNLQQRRAGHKRNVRLQIYSAMAVSQQTQTNGRHV